ncbi:MAG: Spy/CpxP family protein refolding chaperone [Candidatus Gastranaerophilales bacterium]|nr:Spy/CpxP family protein refolding chaperone [Candidatus Gastranaerophilales bacterium]
MNIMKRNLLVLTLLALGGSSMAFAGEAKKCSCPPKQCDRPCCQKPDHRPPAPPKVNIEEKLKLTPEQKEQAKELRMNTREQMRPIIEAIKTKQEQKEIIKHNKSLTAEAQCEQVEKLNKQINELKKQARDLRLKNEKDFEAILTPKQKAQLDKIKADARKDMMKKHKQCPPKLHKK